MMHRGKPQGRNRNAHRKHRPARNKDHGAKVLKFLKALRQA